MAKRKKKKRAVPALLSQQGERCGVCSSFRYMGERNGRQHVFYALPVNGSSASGAPMCLKGQCDGTGCALFSHWH